MENQERKRKKAGELEVRIVYTLLHLHLPTFQPSNSMSVPRWVIVFVIYPGDFIAKDYVDLANIFVKQSVVIGACEKCCMRVLVARCCASCEEC